jgi:hypothetical protein
LRRGGGIAGVAGANYFWYKNNGKRSQKSKIGEGSDLDRTEHMQNLHKNPPQLYSTKKQTKITPTNYYTFFSIGKKRENNPTKQLPNQKPYFGSGKNTKFNQPLQTTQSFAGGVWA